MLILGLGLFVPGAAYSHAVTHFQGPWQAENARQPQPLDDLYYRNEYRLVGSTFIIMSVDTEEELQNPQHGDTWELVLQASHGFGLTAVWRIVYDEPTDCLMQGGQPVICGLAVEEGSREFRMITISGFFFAQCFIEEDQEYQLSAERPESDIPGSPFLFDSTPFVPGNISVTANPGSIHPEVRRTTPLSGQVDEATFALLTAPAIAAETTTITVEVTDSIGCQRPMENALVSFSHSINPGSGSHLHFEDDDLGGTGTYEPELLEGEAREVGLDEITAETSPEGLVRADYEAGYWGLEEIITAELIDEDVPDDAPAESLEDTASLEIRVPGLVPIEPIPGKLMLLGGTSTCDRGHNESPTERQSHYAHPQVAQRVREIAEAFHERTEIEGEDVQQPGWILSVNDVSLEFGGFFDDGDNISDFRLDWRVPEEFETKRNERCHYTHRRGIDVDINRGGSISGCPEKDNLNCNIFIENTEINDDGEEIHRIDVKNALDVLEDMFEDGNGVRWPEERIHFRFHGIEGE